MVLTRTWLPIVLNALVLIVVIVQAHIDHRQWESMDRQLKVMGQTLEQSRVSESPYVHLKSAVIRPVAAGKPPVVDVVVANHGRTPAFKLGVESSFALSGTRKTPQHAYPETRNNGKVFLPSGAENQAAHSDARLALSDEAVQAIKSGRQFLFFFVKGQYTDAWSRPYPLDEICFMYDPEGKNFTNCQAQ